MAQDKDGIAIPDAFRLVGTSQVIAVDSTAQQITDIGADTRAVRMVVTGGDACIHVDSTVDSGDLLLIANTYHTFAVGNKDALWVTTHIDSTATVLRVIEVG